MKGNEEAEDGAELTPKRERFVAEYLVDLNATQAAIRAGYSAKTANEQGARLLANVSVQAAIASAQERRGQRLQLKQDDVLRELWAVATADPNELIEFRRVCCEKCYPDLPYHPGKPINPKCEHCFGEGVGRVHAKDTRLLSPQARRLYAGVKAMRDGLEVKMRDQDAALRDVGRHLGMFKDRLAVELLKKDQILALLDDSGEQGG